MKKQLRWFILVPAFPFAVLAVGLGVLIWLARYVFDRATVVADGIDSYLGWAAK